MAVDSIEEIKALVQRELEAIDQPDLRKTIVLHLVAPWRNERTWDWGEPGEKFLCWTVAEDPRFNLAIVYCEEGFGPSYPWGILDRSGSSLEIDCLWHLSLEHAWRNCPSWEGSNPPGYEVP